MRESEERSTWTSLPVELWTHIFRYIECPCQLAFCSRDLRRIFKSPHAVAQWLSTKYGRPLALYHAFNKHPKLLSHEVAQQLASVGSNVPRFLVQQVMKQQAQAMSVTLEGQESPQMISPGVFAFFMNEGYRRYGDDVNFGGNDLSDFVRILFDPAPDLISVRRMIVEYGWIPMRNYVTHPEEVVYRISKLDMSLLDHMRTNNGWDPSNVNSGVMRRVITDSDFTETVLRGYMDRGFVLTQQAIKAGIRKCDDRTLAALKQHVMEAELCSCVYEIFVDNLAPDFSFSVGLVTFLRQHFQIPEEVVERALIDTKYAHETHEQDDATLRSDTNQLPEVAPGAEGPGVPHTFAPPRSSSLPPLPVKLPHPTTRCFKQQKPSTAWRWVLRTYGPQHRFARACFNDALLCLPQIDAGQRPVTHDYLAAGVKFTPAHVRYLSAIAMGSSGFAVLATHDLLQRMRQQITEGVAISSDEDSESSRMAWYRAFEREIAFLRSLPGRKRSTQEKTQPVWATRKASDPAFPTAWFLGDMETILAELSQHTPDCC
ncbi:hypothetical protein BC832DRAFT_89471 [Gaertneriomyces semiglobifer]|nr:hypothetical protein BC832DRAFT_89471 [Gaertneriomyces semiglobifer]